MYHIPNTPPCLVTGWGRQPAFGKTRSQHAPKYPTVTATVYSHLATPTPFPQNYETCRLDWNEIKTMYFEHLALEWLSPHLLQACLYLLLGKKGQLIPLLN